MLTMTTVKNPPLVTGVKSIKKRSNSQRSIGETKKARRRKTDSASAVPNAPEDRIRHPNVQQGDPESKGTRMFTALAPEAAPRHPRITAL